MARTLSTTARDKMLGAARRIVAARGLDGFSVDAVAAESGVAKTTIYRHFGTTNELLLSALSETIEPLPVADLGSVRADLVHLLRGANEMATQPGRLCLLTAVLQRAAVDDEFAELQRALVRTRKQPIRLAIQRGIGRGEVDPAIDVETVATMVEGPLISRILHEGGRFRPGEIEQIVDLVLRAVAPPDEPADDDG